MELFNMITKSQKKYDIANWPVDKLLIHPRSPTEKWKEPLSHFSYRSITGFSVLVKCNM